MSCNTKSVFTKRSDASDALADINKMLGTNLAGGKRRRGSKKGSKKGSRKGSRKGSKKQRGGFDPATIKPVRVEPGNEVVEEEGQSGGKRRRGSKKASKKESRKGSRKGSRKQSGGREMNPKMKSALAIAKAMKNELNLKGGPAAMGTAFKLLAKHDSESKAIAEIKSNGSAVKKMYDEAQKEMDKKRAAKKASKSKKD